MAALMNMPTNGSPNPSNMSSHAAQQHVPLKSSTRTPTQSPMKKTMMITEAQKQALMDNLQLEVTERARKLRAQYALQAQSLRTRIELRINRIPHSLRQANMGELHERYQQVMKKATTKSAEPEPHGMSVVEETHSTKTTLSTAEPKKPATTKPKGVKRTSEHMENADKENTPDPAQNLPNPKKRSKTAANVPSRQVTNPSTVLSPKSSNSRTLAQSPVRPAFGSPQKPNISHPASPLKLMSPSKLLSPTKSMSPAKSAAIAATTHMAEAVAEKPKPTRGKGATGRKPTNPTSASTKSTSTRPKRGVEAPAPIPEMRTVSSQSTFSTTSNATTVVNKGRKAPAGTAAATQKKDTKLGVSAAKKKIADAPPAGRRVLRKRA